MASPTQSPSSPLGGLHYLLIFSAFGLLALVIIGPKYQERQADYEQQFSGIRRIQQREQQERLAKQDGPAASADPRFDPQTQLATQPDGKQPLIISLRPLMALAAGVMLCAWAGLQWRRLQTTSSAAQAESNSPAPPAHSSSSHDV